MEWIEWVFIVLFGTMLALLIYSIVSTSSAIRKMAQPSVDDLFDGLFNVLFRRALSSKADRSRSEKREL
jgi:hypothetical protein